MAEPVADPPQNTRGIDCFRMLQQVGEGAYGQVFMAQDRETGEIVALKKFITVTERGFDITSIREITILGKLNHQNVIRLKEIVTSPGPQKDEQGMPVDSYKYKGSIYLVFDYMDHDLSGLLRTGIRFSIPQIKCYMRQLLTGLQYCHDNNVLHRDIKSYNVQFSCANLLIDNEGNLKLADFSLSRFFLGQSEILTNRVISLWYRPPELLLGSREYGPEVDMWSVGCIFGELLLGMPIFPGTNELDQLKKIFEKCGTPNENNWPGITQMPLYNDAVDANAMVQQYPMTRRIGEVFQDFDHYALNLLERMLTLDPKQRISDLDALDAEYFFTDPLPCDPKSLPKYEPTHEFQTKKKLQIRPSHMPPRPPIRPGPNQPMHVSRPPMAASGSRGASSSGGYSNSGPNYPQGGQSRSSGPSCGPGNTRNQ